MSDEIVRLEGVGKRFGVFWSLRKLDLSLIAGRLLLVAGPNGAGKTTLLRLIAGISRPTTGRIFVHGRDPARFTGARMAIGWVSHQTALYDNLTARENLAFFARIYDPLLPSDRILEVLRNAGLESRIDSQVRTFSRGMKQRLALARATLHKPSLLLLDEPFTGLDQNATIELMCTLRALKEDNRTCVLVTHRPEVSLDLVNQVMILDNGRARFQGAWPGGTHRDWLDLYENHIPLPT